MADFLPQDSGLLWLLQVLLKESYFYSGCIATGLSCEVSGILLILTQQQWLQLPCERGV